MVRPLSPESDFHSGVSISETTRMFYSITNAQDFSLLMTSKDFITRMRLAWPNAEVRLIEETPFPPFRDMKWELNQVLPTENCQHEYFLIGWVFDEGRTIRIDGPFLACVDFLEWIRLLISSPYQLVFSDIFTSTEIFIVPEMSRRDIIKAFTPNLSATEWDVLENIHTNNEMITINDLITALQLEKPPGQHTIPALDAVLDALSENIYITDANSTYKWAWNTVPMSKMIGHLLQPEIICRAITLTDRGKRAIIARHT